MSVAPSQHNNAFHNDPKFSRLLLASLVVHGLVWLALSGGWLGDSTRPRPPVYYVDLIHKPVLNPQAGRPDPRPVSKPKPEPVKNTAATAPSSVPKDPVKPQVKPPPKPPEAVLPKPEPKPAPKPAPKAAAPADQRQEQKVRSAIDEIRERQAREAERDALKDKLAQLRESVGAAATVSADVPVGMPDGRGDQVGVSALAYVQAFIQQNWALSPYLLDQARLADIEARAILTYKADGRLVRYRLEAPSGNQQFDESLKRAIIKSQQLPQPLPKDRDLEVIFNLKEMAAARR